MPRAAGNVIAFNGRDGVFVDSGFTGPANSTIISSNSIFDNGGLGIDLAPDGVTQNDPGDDDAGANDLQNFPILSSASPATGGGTTIQGTLNSVPFDIFSIEFFVSPECDPFRFGEGKVLLGSIDDVETGASPNVKFKVTLPPTVPLGQFITATATARGFRIGGTSEFSACIPVKPDGDGDGVSDDVENGAPNLGAGG